MKLYRPVGQKTLWPLNSIYLSISPTNPSTYFGGTWVQLKNAFLFATNATSGNKGTGSGTGTSTDAASGDTGSTTLTLDQIPKHKHTLRCGYGDGSTGSDAFRYQYWASTEQGWKDFLVGESGGGKGHTHTLNSHTHTIPYIEIYVFKRTA